MSSASLVDERAPEAEQWYCAHESLARRAAQVGARWWKSLDRTDMNGWFAATSSEAVTQLTRFQTLAAAGADAYVTRCLQSQDVLPDPQGAVNIRALAGLSSDGRDLEALLYGPVVRTKKLIGRGISIPQALSVALADVALIYSSETSDASRTAVGIRQASDLSVTGYIRVTTGTCCPRCAVLAEHIYPFNAEFERHRGCQCTHLPAGLGRLPRTRSAREVFNQLSMTEQDRVWGKGMSAAIRAGSDPTHLVHVSRNRPASAMFSRRVHDTWDGVNRPGHLVHRPGPPAACDTAPRLTPSEIFRIASTRAELINMLRRYSYIT